MNEEVEPLRPDEVLVYRPLLSPGGRGPDGAGDVRESAVRCGRPLVYPVPVAELPGPLRGRARTGGRRYFGVVFAFDLDELPGRGRYTAARFEVAPADPRAIAVQLHADGGALGLTVEVETFTPSSATAARTLAAAHARPGWLWRLVSRGGEARAWLSGVQSPRFGWAYDDPRGRVLLPRSYGMHALVEAPADLATLAGTISVQVEIDRTRRAGLRESVPFDEPLGPDPSPTGAAVRLCMAADVVAYSTHHTPEMRTIQDNLVRVLSEARAAGGIAESLVSPQPQGDGQFTVLPIGIDEAAVIPRLVTGFATALGRVNGSMPPAVRMRLRLALHRGLVEEAANGWVGAATITVHRILDTPPLREALKADPAADFALGVPDVLYQDVILHSVEPPGPDEFSPITIDLPAKRFREHGWLHVGTVPR